MGKSNKKPNSDQERKMVLKFGSGGGIGAVILLGGVLATAALASAFTSRRNRRSSGKDRRSFNRSPPPENDKLNNDSVSLVSTESSALDIKMNGASDVGFVIVGEDFPDWEDKLGVESQNKLPEDEETEGDVCECEDYSKQKENQEQVCIEEVEGFCSGDEEMMSEKKCEDGNEERERGLHWHTQIVEIVGEDEDEENLVKEQEKCEEKQRSETRGKIEEGEDEAIIVSPETIDEGIDEAKDGINLETSGEEEKEEEIVEESSFGSCDVKKSFEEEEVEEKITREFDEDIGNAKGGMNLETSEEEEMVEESSLGSCDVKKSFEEEEVEEKITGEFEVSSETINEDIGNANGGMNLETSEEEEEMVEESSLGRGDVKNCFEEEVEEFDVSINENFGNGMDLETSQEEEIVEESSLGSGDVHKNAKKKIEENITREFDVSSETINEDIDNAIGGMNLETSEEEEEVEESSLGSGDSSSESNSEAVWPAESAKSKLIGCEVGERDDEKIIEDSGNSKYYMVEMGMKKGDRTNSGSAIALLSSLSCSWFFSLSFVSLCLVVFITKLLSEIHGY